MKTLFTSLSFILLVLVLSCDKKDTENPLLQKDIDLSTDKNVYFELQDIVIRFQNNTQYKLWITSCRLYGMERFENGTWKRMGEPPCPGLYPIVIAPNCEVKDTIHNNWLDKGKYRLITDLRKDTAQITVYSNEFEIKDIGY